MITGALSGFLAGLLGIGGGFVVVPAIALVLPYVGIGGPEIMKIAVATSLAIIIPTSLASLQAHAAKSAVDWLALGRLAPGVLAGSVAGALLSTFISSLALTVLFCVLMLYTAFRMFVTAGNQGAALSPLPGVFSLSFRGAGIGVASSLLGVGGAFLSIPVLANHTPIHRAIGTASALGLPLAIGGAASYLLLASPASCSHDCVGYVFLPAVSTAGMAAVLTAPWGARLAHATSVATLRRIFASVLIVVAGGLIYRAAPENVTRVAQTAPPSGQVSTKAEAPASESNERIVGSFEEVMLARGVRYGPLRGVSGDRAPALRWTSVHDWGGEELTSVHVDAHSAKDLVEHGEVLAERVATETASVRPPQRKAEVKRQAHSHAKRTSGRRNRLHAAHRKKHTHSRQHVSWRGHVSHRGHVSRRHAGSDRDLWEGF
jgi:uncharacterized membrane protein YfcA